MNYDLYFIPIIEKVLYAGADKARALEDAFYQIEAMGKRDRYKTGYRQFCMFMAEVGFSMRDITPEQLEREFDNYFKRPDIFAVTLEKNGEPIHTFSFTFTGGSESITHITPADYRLVLDTGLCIWSDRLRAADLTFGDDLKMAADDGAGRKPSRVETILDGAGRLYIYPGPFSGEIKITINSI